eukprot:7819447-Pyramimonas_sp.AAC.1
MCHIVPASLPDIIIERAVCRWADNIFACAVVWMLVDNPQLAAEIADQHMQLYETAYHILGRLKVEDAPTFAGFRVIIHEGRLLNTHMINVNGNCLRERNDIMRPRFQHCLSDTPLARKVALVLSQFIACADRHKQCGFQFART